MNLEFDYDVFLSYSDIDREEVSRIAAKFRVAGLRAFQAAHDLKENVGQKDWEKKIYSALSRSDHLVVFCSSTATDSDWVKEEVRRFDAECQKRLARGSNEHKILVIPDPRLAQKRQDEAIAKIPVLRPLLRPESVDDAVEIVAHSRIDRLRAALNDARNELAQSRDLAWKSFTYYRHARFWRPFSEAPGEGLHIFTCGRDTHPGPDRGTGGRTNIDIWDYQAAVDITHYFARHHRDTQVKIEQPMSKSGIDEGTRTFDTNEFSKLLNDNCVVIGSPDVSDFAEIALAKILGVSPYEPEEDSVVAFRIRKAGKRFSTFYQAVPAKEQGGIELWDGTFFKATESKDYGVLVLADNPFSQQPDKHKILILAGHSGVSTRALSLLLTSEDEWCLKPFYELDEELAKISGPIAAVIEVGYRRRTRSPSTGTARSRKVETKAGDNREINGTPGSVRVCRVIDLSRMATIRPAEHVPAMQFIRLPGDVEDPSVRPADPMAAEQSLELPGDAVELPVADAEGRTGSPPQ